VLISAGLTAEDRRSVARLADAASAQLGQKISASAILRALIRVHGQSPGDQRALTKQIVSELGAGRMWGSPVGAKRRRPPQTDAP